MAAEVGGDHGHDKKGKKGRKKSSTRIDMTPMVDLGFLLLTFFVLTTTMSTPKSMPIVLPEKDVKKEDEKPIAGSKVLNLIAGEDNKIYYYRSPAGDEKVDLKETVYGKDGVRKVIYDVRKQVDAKWGIGKDGISEMIVIIKMSDASNYRNMVDLFDEMNITSQHKYVKVDVSKDELKLIDAYKKDKGTN